MDVNIPVGNTTTLTCSATGYALMYSWQMRRSGSSWKRINNANSPSYTTDSNMAVGQYDYRCTVRNDAGSTSQSATVMVYGEYYITKNHNLRQYTTVIVIYQVLTLQEDHA